jgi:hypothetical protein
VGRDINDDIKEICYNAILSSVRYGTISNCIYRNVIRYRPVPYRAEYRVCVWEPLGWPDLWYLSPWDDCRKHFENCRCLMQHLNRTVIHYVRRPAYDSRPSHNRRSNNDPRSHLYADVLPPPPFKQINTLQILYAIPVADFTWKCKSVMPSQKVGA